MKLVNPGKLILQSNIRGMASSCLPYSPLLWRKCLFSTKVTTVVLLYSDLKLGYRIFFWMLIYSSHTLHFPKMAVV